MIQIRRALIALGLDMWPQQLYIFDLSYWQVMTPYSCFFSTRDCKCVQRIAGATRRNLTAINYTGITACCENTNFPLFSWVLNLSCYIVASLLIRFVYANVK